MINDKFFSAIADFHMLTPGQSVTVGVSGGADSMCLLHLLKSHENALHITVRAVHVNHGIRGKEADEDEAFVKEYCQQHGVELRCFFADIPQISRHTGESTESCARRIRYQCFSAFPSDKIATAHTGSDTLETVFMNLSRGAGLPGLTGIPPVRGNIIRPLIYCTREETERYCKENKILYVTDSTNLKDEYTRNRYRHTVVPALKEINPVFEENALRCVELIREENDFLRQTAKNTLDACYNECEKSLDLQKLFHNHPVLVRRVLALFLGETVKTDFEYRHIEALLQNALTPGYTLMLPGAKAVSNQNGFLVQKKETTEESVFIPGIRVNKRELPQTVRFGDYRITLQKTEGEPTENTRYAVDFYKIGDIIDIRSRIAGDEMTLPGRGVTKSIKKLFTELKIPPQKRNGIPVIADENGVIAVAGISVNAKRTGKINENKQYLLIKAECDESC